MISQDGQRWFELLCRHRAAHIIATFPPIQSRSSASNSERCVAPLIYEMPRGTATSLTILRFVQRSQTRLDGDAHSLRYTPLPMRRRRDLLLRRTARERRGAIRILRERYVNPRPDEARKVWPYEGASPISGLFSSGRVATQGGR